jgi:hypothetical protein
MLDELVRVRGERLANEGVAVNTSSVIRGLIRQAADAEGIKPAGTAENDTAPARRKPRM